MDQPSRKKLSLGKIGFLNVLPIYHPLESGILPHPFSIVAGVPSHLNGLMARGLLDISVVSSIEYARNPGRYTILPDLSIACFGAVESVLLLSRKPVKELGGETVLASTQSHTSVGLLKILAARRFGIELNVSPGNVSERLAQKEPPAAVLAIGDEALELRRKGIFPHVLDMGEEWSDWTGLPFVFALWVAQKSVIQAADGMAGAGVSALLSAKRWGRENPELVCAEAAQRGILTVEELRRYYGRLYYDLGKDEQKGLRLFYKYLFETGQIDAAPDIEIYAPLASVA